MMEENDVSMISIAEGLTVKGGAGKISVKGR